MAELTGHPGGCPHICPDCRESYAEYIEDTGWTDVDLDWFLATFGCVGTADDPDCLAVLRAWREASDD